MELPQRHEGDETGKERRRGGPRRMEGMNEWVKFFLWWVGVCVCGRKHVAKKTFFAASAVLYRKGLRKRPRQPLALGPREASLQLLGNPHFVAQDMT